MNPNIGSVVGLLYVGILSYAIASSPKRGKTCVATFIGFWCGLSLGAVLAAICGPNAAISHVSLFLSLPMCLMFAWGSSQREKARLNGSPI
jgi:uncharacterized membrane protein